MPHFHGDFKIFIICHTLYSGVVMYLQGNLHLKDVNVNSSVGEATETVVLMDKDCPLRVYYINCS